MSEKTNEYLPVAEEATVMPATPLAVVRQPSGAIGAPLSIEELHQRLQFVRDVMRRELTEDQDYGKIPGCGDKPTLLQPGAQKLLLTFNLCERVKREDVRDLPHPSVAGHREYAFTLTVVAPNGKEWDGVGTCSTLESKYRYRKAERTCPQCGKTAIIAENPKFVKAGQIPGWLCWKKKNGCGATFGKNDPAITGQGDGKAENQDPADTWNTVRKIAFKRALVAAAINATNTSELWTQDIEDSVDRGQPVNMSEDDSPPHLPTPPPQPAPAKPPTPTPRRKIPTAKTRAFVLDELQAAEGGANREIVTTYLRALGWLGADKEIEKWPINTVPESRKEIDKLKLCLGQYQADPAKVITPYPPHTIPGGSEPAPVATPKVSTWANFVVPAGKHKGKPLHKVPTEEIRDLWSKNQFSDEDIESQELPPEVIETMKRLREALALAAAELGFTRKETV